MGVVVKLAIVRQHKEEERWREVGYRAIDEMVTKLTAEIEGKSFEELSELWRSEGQAVTGAILAEVLRSTSAKMEIGRAHV